MLFTKSQLLNDPIFIKELSQKLQRNSGVISLIHTLESLDLESNDDSYLIDLILIHLQKHVSKTNYAKNLVEYFIAEINASEQKEEIFESISKALDDARIETKKKNKMPWFEIVGDLYDEERKQILMKFDWNDAFIKILKDKGYVGETDEDMIQLWLQEIANQK